MAPALAGWLGFIGIRNWLVDTPTESGTAARLVSVLAFAVIAFYFVDLEMDLSMPAAIFLYAQIQLHVHYDGIRYVRGS